MTIWHCLFPPPSCQSHSGGQSQSTVGCIVCSLIIARKLWKCPWGRLTPELPQLNLGLMKCCLLVPLPRGDDSTGICPGRVNIKSFHFARWQAAFKGLTAAVAEGERERIISPGVQLKHSFRNLSLPTQQWTSRSWQLQPTVVKQKSHPDQKHRQQHPHHHRDQAQAPSQAHLAACAWYSWVIYWPERHLPGNWSAFN